MPLYAISDIHGCYEQFMQVLHASGFSDGDELFVLGRFDVFFRHDGAIRFHRVAKRVVEDGAAARADDGYDVLVVRRGQNGDLRHAFGIAVDL